MVRSKKRWNVQELVPLLYYSMPVEPQMDELGILNTGCLKKQKTNGMYYDVVTIRG